MSLTRYTTYRETGLEWLETIPSHWEVKRLKQFCSAFPSNVDKKSIEGEAPVKLCNYTDVYYNDFIAEDLEFMEATATEEEIKKFTLQAGDTIITKDSETADDIAIAACVTKDLPGVICGYHLSVIRPKEVAYGAFVKRLFDSIYAKSLFAVRANGLTRVGLSQYAIDNVELPLPPIKEQKAIASFLDRETAKIDALIAEQQRLIELLQEKRQAVISHAVTKGLNPNAPMKDSGVEWLGEVPEHWDVIRIKNIGRSTIGLTYSPADIVSEGNGIPVLRASNIQNGSLDWEDTVFVRVRPDAELLIKPGDILICARSGSRSLIGKNVLICSSDIEREMTFGAFMTILRCIDPPFTRWTLSSTVFKAQAGAYMSTTINQLTASTLMNTALAFPPKEERDGICSYLEEKTKEMDHLIDEASQSIQLLQERRSALISAAVTGQIDVRGLVPEVAEQ